MDANPRDRDLFDKEKELLKEYQELARAEESFFKQEEMAHY